jgi:hypothetical protein
MAFTEAVRKYQDRFAESDSEPQSERSYFGDVSRLREAGLVEDLVNRFVSAEMAGRPIGRSATRALVPPLGKYLGKQLGRADDITRLAVRDAVLDTVARAYVTVMPAEVQENASFKSDRHPKQIWAFWIPRVYSPFLTEAMPGGAVDAIQTRAAQNLIDQLGSLDFGRRAKGRRMAMIGMAYGEAGAILRVAQTSRIPDEMIERPDAALQVRWPNAWRYEDYPA